MNYMEQDAAATVLWEEFHLHGLASYPLVPVPPAPGTRPPRWRWIAWRRWKRARDAYRAAKAWNFGALYGRNVSQVHDAIVIESDFPWTRDAWEQMFPPGKCDQHHTKTRDQVID